MGAFEHLIEAAKQGDVERAKGILESEPSLANLKDQTGATPLHYAALHGHREIVRLLVERGADINCTDGQFGATPAGWAIEYLREMGGFLGIELADFAYAIRLGDVRWVSRFLQRFPALRAASDTEGRPFQELARELGNREILALLGLRDVS
jgi:ankyrin repeat protein